LALRLQSTPRVGGGSAFFVRPLDTLMSQYYIQGNHIYGPKMSGQFYIQGDYIYGPKHSGQYYIQGGYIYGPKKSGRFYISNNYIYGPNEELPWLED
jgi:hypothetical protein